MKVNDPLNNILDSRVKIECLRHLCRYPTELNGRQLSRYLKITPKSIHKAMSSLVDEGVVILTPHGNSFGYSFNKDTWVNKQLIGPLFEKEKELLDEIIRKIKTEIEGSSLKKHIISAALFGSVQKKDDSSRSDFDLLILADHEDFISSVEEEIEKIGTKLMKEYGIVLGPYVKTAASFKAGQPSAVTRSILSSHQIIYGKELAHGRKVH